MKLIKSPQKALIIFLTSIIIVSFFFIVRLEIKAAELQTQWEKHQESLKKNEDVLEGLKEFSRIVKSNFIKIDGNSIQLNIHQSLVTLFKNSIKTESSKQIQFMLDVDKMFGINTMANQFIIRYQGSKIMVGSLANQVKGIYLQGGSSQVYIVDNKVSIESQKLSIEANGDINITSKNGNVNINGKKVNLNE